ncbi:hypothetical protein OG413_36520 [Streptomyces sp. NBC_01433]|uniref:hypothetical protein n=1 Tax=Streptomyces sp. NBC_01433 TaxID=2903864 RepID=UPI002250D817|nr:hypothetical protein [Streptomyces sp. NBC_01433]MCX4680720.1 hypothetical protein [Streptomyces sp. NBC_01433]
MEQSIDSNTKPEFAAGTDPAYIPGLTAPSAARTEDKKPTSDDDPAGVDVDVDVDAHTDTDADVDGEADADTSPEASAAGEEPEPAAEDGAEEGAVFEVSDRRGSIRVDREGVRFRLDDQEAEFLWDEIGAVEVKTARFARRFTVTVHLSTRRWFNAEVEAESRTRLKEWPGELDTVLDAYFEES